MYALALSVLFYILARLSLLVIHFYYANKRSELAWYMSDDPVYFDRSRVPGALYSSNTLEV